jgi:hypothetical protein
MSEGYVVVQYENGVTKTHKLGKGAGYSIDMVTGIMRVYDDLNTYVISQGHLVELCIPNPKARSE